MNSDSPRSTVQDLYEAQVWRVYAFFTYRLGSREDAEDLTQITFERAAKAISRYDANRGSPRTWLLSIAGNVLIDHFRRGGARPQTRTLMDEDLERDHGGPTQDELGLDPEVEAALAVLSDRDRQVVALRYGGDMTGPEIAELLDLSLANVQQILSRSLRRMRTVIEDERGLSAD